MCSVLRSCTLHTLIYPLLSTGTLHQEASLLQQPRISSVMNRAAGVGLILSLCEVQRGGRCHLFLISIFQCHSHSSLFHNLSLPYTLWDVQHEREAQTPSSLKANSQYGFSPVGSEAARVDHSRFLPFICLISNSGLWGFVSYFVFVSISKVKLYSPKK